MITRTAFAALAIALTACGQQGATPQEMPKNEPTLPGPEDMPGPDEGVYFYGRLCILLRTDVVEKRPCCLASFGSLLGFT